MSKSHIHEEPPHCSPQVVSAYVCILQVLKNIAARGGAPRQHSRVPFFSSDVVTLRYDLGGRGWVGTRRLLLLPAYLLKNPTDFEHQKLDNGVEYSPPDFG